MKRYRTQSMKRFDESFSHRFAHRNNSDRSVNLINLTKLSIKKYIKRKEKCVEELKPSRTRTKVYSLRVSR